MPAAFGPVRHSLYLQDYRGVHKKKYPPRARVPVRPKRRRFAAPKRHAGPVPVFGTVVEVDGRIPGWPVRGVGGRTIDGAPAPVREMKLVCRAGV